MEEVLGFILELGVDLLSDKKEKLDITGRRSKVFQYLYAVVILIFLVMLLGGVLFVFNLGGLGVKITSSIVGVAVFVLLVSIVIKVLKSNEDKDPL